MAYGLESVMLLKKIEGEKGTHERIQENFQKDIVKFSTRVNEEMTELIEREQKKEAELRKKLRDLWV